MSVLSFCVGLLLLTPSESTNRVALAPLPVPPPLPELNSMCGVDADTPLFDVDVIPLAYVPVNDCALVFAVSVVLNVTHGVTSRRVSRDVHGEDITADVVD